MRFFIPEKLSECEWTTVGGTQFQIMTNGSGELFVRLLHQDGNKEVRLSPTLKGFSISDFNSPGKIKIQANISVE